MDDLALNPELQRAKLVSVAEMAALEKAADASGHAYAAMMELAGAAVAQQISQQLPRATQVLVLVGPGNNGGDGLVCARYLHQAGITVCAYLWKRRTEPEYDYENHYAQLVALGVATAHADTDQGLTTLRHWLTAADCVVDALLGTGSNRPIEGQLAALLDLVKAVRRDSPFWLVAVDCASGLNCDTGAVDPHTVAADGTITFAYAKHGHYHFPGVEVTGALTVVDIGIDPALAAEIRTFVLNETIVRAWQPKRSPNSHKGSFGKLMAAVGSVNFPGAAYLCCAAAGRVGAGLVTGAVIRDVWTVIAGKLPEPTWEILPTGEGDAAGVVGGDAAPLLATALEGYSALLFGCGLNQKPTTVQFVERLLRDSSQLPPTLIDADGLNCLAKLANWPARLPAQTVLTPHAAELGRLCGIETQTAVAQRWQLAREQAAAWQAVVLAKGPYTVIGEPGGWLAVLPIATAALATAGTGDVLSGTIAGLLAQGVAPFQAACLGAWLHGQAGLRCAAALGQSGVVASDLLPHLPAILAGS